MVVMGVAGCGKSSLGAALARAEGALLIEGDEHHSAANLEKMRRGIPLSDADRQGWLDALAAELRARPHGAVLTCSALKRAYRERLRAAAPGLRFVFMEIDPAAMARTEEDREPRADRTETSSGACRRSASARTRHQRSRPPHDGAHFG